MEIQIQKIQIPVKVSEQMQNMYFRTLKGQYSLNNNNQIELKAETRISFDTYFNSFSIGKWKKYTILERLWLNCSYKGCGVIKILYSYILNNQLVIDTLLEYRLHADMKKEEKIELPIDSLDKGQIYIELEADLREDLIFFEIAFQTEISQIRQIKIGIDICTFHREQYLIPNLKKMESELWNNKNSVMYHNFQVVVVDNGNSINNINDQEFVSVIPNRNYGGAAGFTRGIMYYLEHQVCDYIILMDDDIELNCAAIERNYCFLMLLKEEYHDYMMGGAMLRKDFPFVQHESGGKYLNGKIVSMGRGIDLREYRNVVQNEYIEQVDYNAWWYCCIPIEVIRDNGLPLPLFIHNDDIEYGLRNHSKVILLNGIAVWHEAFEQKRPSSNEYYDVRNTLIVNSIYCKHFRGKNAAKLVLMRMVTNLFRYRYKDIMLIARAVQDYLKGAEWLGSVNAESLNEEIRALGYLYAEEYEGIIEKRDKICLDHLLQGMSNYNQIDKKKLLSLNGWLIPACKCSDAYPIMAGESPHKYYRRKKVWVYDPDTDLGFYTYKSYKEFIHCIWVMWNSCFKIFFGYKKKSIEYQQKIRNNQSMDFWNKYLGLEKTIGE